MQGRLPRKLHPSGGDLPRTSDGEDRGQCWCFGSIILISKSIPFEDFKFTIRAAYRGVSAIAEARVFIKCADGTNTGPNSPLTQEKRHEYPSYKFWNGDGNMQPLEGAGFPSTTSQLVGHVPTPEGMSENFPWSWYSPDVKEQSDEYEFKGIRPWRNVKADMKAVMIEIPLFVQAVNEDKIPLPGAKTDHEKQPSFPDRLAWKSKVHEWGLGHSLQVLVDGKIVMHAFTLKDILGTSAAKDDGKAQERDEREVEQGREGGEGPPWRIQAYFKEKTLDRDMDYLRAVDPGIMKDMTVATGRLYWPSKWDQDRALYVTVPSKRSAYYNTQKTVRAPAKPEHWWSKPEIEPGMHETSPYLLRFLVEHIWNVKRPRLVLTIVGGADEFQMALGLKDKILGGIMDVAKTMQAWIITGGSDSGIMKYVGEARNKEGTQVPLIGIMPWGVVRGRQGLLATPSDCTTKPPAEQLPQDYEASVLNWNTLTKKWHNEKENENEKVEKPTREASLNHNHTHFILVKDGESHMFGTEIPLRTAFEGCVTSHTSYTREILTMLKDQKLGWQGMNVEKILWQYRRRLSGSTEDDFCASTDAEVRDQGKTEEGQDTYGEGGSSGWGAGKGEGKCRHGKQQGKDREIRGEGEAAGGRKLDNHPPSQSVIPAVCVVIEGGPGSIETASSAAVKGTPVVIIKKTGRAADLLADVSDIYDPDVERNTSRMDLVIRAFELLDSIPDDKLEESGENHEASIATKKALDAYGFESLGDFSERANLLFRSRDAVCTGRCFTVDYDEDAQNVGDLNGGILESILWCWGSDANAAKSPPTSEQDSIDSRAFDPSACVIAQGAGTTAEGYGGQEGDVRGRGVMSAKRHLGIRYSPDLFLKKLIIIVQWDRPDLLRSYLEDVPPKSSCSGEVYRGMANVWQMALDAALEEAIVSRQKRQVELVKVLLEQGANLEIFKVDQIRLCKLMLQVPQVQTVLGLEEQHFFAKKMSSISLPKRSRQQQHVSAKKPEADVDNCKLCSLEALKCLTSNDKDVLAARRWMRLMGVRKHCQDAGHLNAMLRKSKKTLIRDASKPKQFKDPGDEDREWGGVLHKDAHAMLRIASVGLGVLKRNLEEEEKKGNQSEHRDTHSSLLSSLASYTTKEEDETQEICISILVKIARNLVKIDRLYADSLGPQFRYKLGMMDPQWDLMLWSVLVNRTELAVFFWERASQPVVSALTAIKLYRAISGDVRSEMQEDILSAIEGFEKRAVSVQQEAMQENVRLALEHLESPVLLWGGWTGYDLAVEADCREFVTKCCRQVNLERWYGDMMPLRHSSAWCIPIDLCLFIYVAFFPMFWAALAFQLSYNPKQGIDELKLASCFPYPSSPWFVTPQETKSVMWAVTALMLPLLLVAPICIEYVNCVGWRIPPVSETLRPPGQRRKIPVGYPSEPFANPHLFAYYTFVMGRVIANDLRSMGKMSWVSYKLYSVRQSFSFWLGRIRSNIFFPFQRLNSGLSLSHAALGEEIKRVLANVSESVSDPNDPKTTSDWELYVAKKAAQDDETRFIKWMQTLRKNPDAWSRMSLRDTDALWAHSFFYVEQLLCFMRAPATAFAMNSVTYLVFVVVFTILVIHPEYSEKRISFVPWEEVFVTGAMVALLFQEFLQILQGKGASRYFHDFWNLLDLMGQILFWIGFVMRIYCVVAGSCSEKHSFVMWNCPASPPLIESCDGEQSEHGMCASEQLFRGYKGFEYWPLTRQLYGLSCGLSWLRLLHIFSPFESMGSLVLGIVGMFKPIRAFIMIILICITGFAVMIAGGRTAPKCLPSDDVQAVHGFCLTYWWWLRTYFMGYGEIPMDDLQDVISLVVACVALLFVQLILMNTAFVAMITSSFDAVMVQSKENWLISQYALTEDYIACYTTVPVPFNVIYHVPRFIISILSWLAGWKLNQSAQILEHKRREVAFCCMGCEFSLAWSGNLL
jgi:hypothetical protein